MKPDITLKKANNKEKTVLNEAEAKKLLSGYGVPVVREVTAADPDEAGSKALELGFPVVLKGLGPRLTHKTEKGLVRLNLTSPDQVRQAGSEMAWSAGDELEGWLVQPYLSGRREFMAGLFRDDQFGLVVMFGLGGTFTEVLDDVVFRVGPVDEVQAGLMLDEIKSAGLLGPFRGERAVNRDQIIQTLAGLGRLGLERPDVAEVDINPLLVTPDGQVTAVDALVVLGRAEPQTNLRPAIDPGAVGAVFNPKSVAVVGATDKFRKWGNMIFLNLVAGGFKGEIYPVNPTLETLAGRPAYKSVTDIPGPVDVAVVTVPASKVLGLIPEFKAKGVKGVVLITSGFAEAGSEGRELERLLVEEARKSGVLILGPNTMGITNPHINLFCIGTQVRPKPGSTAFVSQSGNMGVQLLSFANRQGLGIRAFAGTGNEAMLTVEDALDAFGLDELTDTILLYIESVKNGRRFFESAHRVSRQKPVVVLRGGRTPAGSVAAATHTGAMASNVRVFDAACRQAGIALVEKPMDLLDLSTCFSSLPLPRGSRVAIMTIGGGWGVVTSDLCADYGLELPGLPPDLVSRIGRVLPPFWSRCNPVDLVGQTDPGVPIAVMDELLAWDGCDALINLGVMGRKHLVRLLAESSLAVDPQADKSLLDSTMQGLDQIEIEFTSHIVRLMEEHNKPIIGVGMASDGKGQTIFEVEGGRYKGVFFQTPEQAVKSLSRMRRYREWLEREGVFT